MGITSAGATEAGEGGWEECCVLQHLLAPFLLGLTSEDLTPVPVSSGGPRVTCPVSSTSIGVGPNSSWI